MRERNSEWPQTLLLAKPRGFCAGVVRAVEALNTAVQQSQKPIYSYHEIIHNTHIVEGFKNEGVSFVNSIDDVPDGANLFISAHGVQPQIVQQAEQRGMNIVDATCPLVTKTHTEAKRFLREGRTLLYIGHANHDETMGTLGHAPQIRLVEKPEDVDKLEVEDPDKVALISQTTLSMDDMAKIKDAILKRFPNIAQPRVSDICFATQNRQNGVKLLIEQGAEAVIVNGSPSSSNSKRLQEVTAQYGAQSFFVDDVSELNPESLRRFGIVGLTAGASAPENKFKEIIDFFIRRGSVAQELMVPGAEENFQFDQPKGLEQLR